MSWIVTVIRWLLTLLVALAVGCTWSARWDITVHSEGNVAGEVQPLPEVE